MPVVVLIEHIILESNLYHLESFYVQDLRPLC